MKNGKGELDKHGVFGRKYLDYDSTNNNTHQKDHEEEAAGEEELVLAAEGLEIYITVKSMQSFFRGIQLFFTYLVSDL